MDSCRNMTQWRHLHLRGWCPIARATASSRHALIAEVHVVRARSLHSLSLPFSTLRRLDAFEQWVIEASLTAHCNELIGTPRCVCRGAARRSRLRYGPLTPCRLPPLPPPSSPSFLPFLYPCTFFPFFFLIFPEFLSIYFLAGTFVVLHPGRVPVKFCSLANLKIFLGGEREGGDGAKSGMDVTFSTKPGLSRWYLLSPDALSFFQ